MGNLLVMNMYQPCVLYIYAAVLEYIEYIAWQEITNKKSYTHRKWKYNCRNSYVDILFTLGILA